VPNVGVAGTGGRGTFIGGALEQSNVDMAQEFTEMILAQRGYQANGKMITVSDQLLVDTLNLKRKGDVVHRPTGARRLSRKDSTCRSR
jgi:flagellar hook protein FlgE